MTVEDEDKVVKDDPCKNLVKRTSEAKNPIVAGT